MLQCKELFNAKPVLLRAFNAAKGLSGKGGQADDFVEKNEFRALLEYMYHYFLLYKEFETLDRSGDHRLDRGEFHKGVSLLTGWGLEVSSPDAVFDEIDTDHGGMI